MCERSAGERGKQHEDDWTEGVKTQGQGEIAAPKLLDAAGHAAARAVDVKRVPDKAHRPALVIQARKEKSTCQHGGGDDAAPPNAGRRDSQSSSPAATGDSVDHQLCIMELPTIRSTLPKMPPRSMPSVMRTLFSPSYSANPK